MSEPASPSADTKRVIPIQPAASQQRREETVSLYKKTEKIYAREVSGWFSRWRWVLVWVTQIVFYGTPWLMWNDQIGRAHV